MKMLALVASAFATLVAVPAAAQMPHRQQVTTTRTTVHAGPAARPVVRQQTTNAARPVVRRQTTTVTRRGPVVGRSRTTVTRSGVRGGSRWAAHVRACRARYRSYDQRTDRFWIRAGVSRRCVL